MDSSNTIKEFFENQGGIKMELNTISGLAIAGVICSVVLSIGVPIALFIAGRVKLKARISSFFIGAGTFLLFAMLLEQQLHYLAQAAGKVIAVEIDKNLIPILEDTLSGYDNVRVINEDVLKLDLKKLADEENNGKPVKVVANLPYYITTPIIMGLFENEVPVESITVMVQKEVADRMQTGPGNKDYGALSLAVQYYADPYIVANVPPNCFMPRPKVGSAVIRLTCHQEKPVQVQDEKLMFNIIRASFNQRRKTLANGLKNAATLDFTKEEVEAAIDALGKGASVRGETLTLEEFARLSDLLSPYKKG